MLKVKRRHRPRQEFIDLRWAILAFQKTLFTALGVDRLCEWLNNLLAKQR